MSLMRRGGVLFAALAVVATSAHAQSTDRKPFEAVSVTYDRERAADPGFVDVLKRVRAAIDKQIVQDLAPLLARDFAVIECAANPLTPCAPGKSKILAAKVAAPIDRLRLALCCDGDPASAVPRIEQDEAVTGTLGSILAAAGAGGSPDLRDAVCVPALPAFDRARAAKAVAAARVEPEDLRVTNTQVTLRTKADKSAPVAATLPAGSLALLVTGLTASVPDGWSVVALPAGGIGYTDELAFEDTAPPALCFTKGAAGWQASTLIQRGG